MKRFFDILISLAAIVIFSPVFLIVILILKITSSGSAIFKQERAGKNGTPFIFYKFRTMKVDVDSFGPSPKSGDDPRLTKIGKFLREYSLDELPQLFNVIIGDMSIVGPRPLYIAQIQEWDERQKKRLLAKPGLTGLAQISGRGEITREEKLELDVKYIENRSLGLDLKIIFKTFGQIFKRKNIYEKRYSKTEHTRGENSQQ
ncbi:MAG: sugar transferase [Planctomycetota bacterium]|jgi:lipopolysaccharide/colanic/teichoic acid biosynthesis glycosyltransferase